MALDEATAALMAKLAAEGVPPFHEMTVQEARAYGSKLEPTRPLPAMAAVEDVSIEAPQGHRLPGRILTPPGEVRGTLLYYHGGGWVTGAFREIEHVARELAARTGCVVALVDYRLAPEHRYPAAVDDAWAAFEWTGRNLAALTGNGEGPLIVAGDSAGANLAAVVSQRSTAAGGPPIRLQVLVYPVVDVDFDRASYLDPENQLDLSRETMMWFWDHYAPDHEVRREPSASPLHGEDLEGMAPAILVTAEHDVLRDEGEAYADRLEAAGVRVHRRRFDGQKHGFFLLDFLPQQVIALEYVAEIVTHYLRSDD